MDILEQIKARYDGFSKTRKRISDYILSEPEQCCFCSLKNFAQKVNATEVTVLNFCRALGLNSYLELKKALQDYVIVRVNPGKRLKLAVSGSGSAQDLYARVSRAERDALQTTFEGNRPEEVMAFVECLRRARRVYIVAHDFSRILASYLNYRLLALGVRSHLLDLQDRRDMFSRLSRAPREGLLVAVSIPPYGAETIATARYCADIGMPVAAVTDRPDAPVTRDAAASLCCHVELMSITNSFTAMIGMVDMVAMLYSFAAGDGCEIGERELSELRQRFESYFPAEMN